MHKQSVPTHWWAEWKQCGLADSQLKKNDVAIIRFCSWKNTELKIQLNMEMAFVSTCSPVTLQPLVGGLVALTHYHRKQSICIQSGSDNQII